MPELTPLTKIVWNANQTQIQWSNMLNLIGNLNFEVEYQMVKQGLKEAYVFQSATRNYEDSTRRILADKLTLLPIPPKTFYDKSILLNGLTPNVKRLDTKAFVVSSNLATAKEFITALEDNNCRAVGELLGYPKCCYNAFDSDFDNAIFDPCYEAAVRTSKSVKLQDKVFVDGNGLTNIMLRYFGIKIIPFFPCSFDCQEAQKVAKAWFNLLETMDSKMANTIITPLNQPMTWSLHKQIIYVKTPLFKGITNGYNCTTKKEVIWNNKLATESTS